MILLGRYLANEYGSQGLVAMSLDVSPPYRVDANTTARRNIHPAPEILG